MFYYEKKVTLMVLFSYIFLTSFLTLYLLFDMNIHGTNKVTLYNTIWYMPLTNEWSKVVSILNKYLQILINLEIVWSKILRYFNYFIYTHKRTSINITITSSKKMLPCEIKYISILRRKEFIFCILGYCIAEHSPSISGSTFPEYIY